MKPIFDPVTNEKKARAQELREKTVLDRNEAKVAEKYKTKKKGKNVIGFVSAKKTGKDEVTIYQLEDGSEVIEQKSEKTGKVTERSTWPDWL